MVESSNQETVQGVPEDVTSDVRHTNPMVGSNVTASLSLFGALVNLATLFPLGGIVSVVLGYIALGQIKVTGERGRRTAIAGLTIGWLQILTQLIVILVVASSAPTLLSGLSSFFSSLSGGFAGNMGPTMMVTP